jgi:hypothetical protein
MVIPDNKSMKDIKNEGQKRKAPAIKQVLSFG